MKKLVNYALEITMISWVMEYFLPFALILGVLVFVHEFGHFWVARKNGVKVSTFSIGFGPQLFGWTDSKGTRWCLSIIPLGGYVKFFGDQDVSSARAGEEIAEMSEAEKSHTLHAKTPMQRIAVAFAGPLANFIFALVVLVGLIGWRGIPHIPNVIGSVVSDSLASRIGLQAGDKITKFNEVQINRFEDLALEIKQASGQDVIITVERNGQSILLQAPFYTIEPATGDKKPISNLGIRPDKPEYEKISFINSIKYSFTIIKEMSMGILKGIYGLITQQKSASELGGILAIGDTAAQSVKSGLADTLWLMAVLSINLGVINLLPIPVLDGGHILLCTIEAIRRKPLSEKIQESIFKIGLFIVLSLMIYSNWNDLVRYKVVQSVMSLFGLGK